jgi:hypothetical protein
VRCENNRAVSRLDAADDLVHELPVTAVKTQRNISAVANIIIIIIITMHHNTSTYHFTRLLDGSIPELGSSSSTTCTTFNAPR